MRTFSVWDKKGFLGYIDAIDLDEANEAAAHEWAQVATNLRFFWDNTTWPKGYDVGLSYLFHTEMLEALKIAYGSNSRITA